MINLDSITSENNKEHNEKWPYISDHPDRNALFNLINEHVIDKIYLHAKDLREPKYEFLIKKRENVGIKHENNSKAFIEYSNTMDDVYENIDDYNPVRKGKKLIVLDDMIADIMSNKNFKQ